MPGRPPRNRPRCVLGLPKVTVGALILKLIRVFLQARVMETDAASGPLSHLLLNVVLDEFDRELERRGLIYVRSRRAGERKALRDSS
jgi:hypothetical protein